MKTQKPYQVCFHTNGPIDPLSWEVIGMSAKESNSAIGQFGSGLKFAIAILLRTGHDVEIMSGEHHYEFSTTKREFRGKTFDIVCCNGKELSITTEMGGHWELWMAYRELVSNEIDEGGIHYAGEPMPDGTTIVVSGEDFHALLAKHEEFFVGEREPISTSDKFRVFRGDGSIFYRGVRVDKVEGSKFSYESLQKLDLTEDRTVKDKWSLESNLFQDLVTNDMHETTFLHELVTQPKESFESAKDYDWLWSDKFSSVVTEQWTNSPTLLNEHIVRLVPKRMKNYAWETQDFDEDQQIMMNAAQDFLEKMEYPLTVTPRLIKNNDANNIAFVFKNEIYLTSRAFDQGLFFLVTTLFEEQCHIQGFADRSLQYQNFLIQMLITRTKRHLKIAL